MRFGLRRFVALPAALLSPPLLGWQLAPLEERAEQAPAVREMLRRARP